MTRALLSLCVSLVAVGFALATAEGQVRAQAAARELIELQRECELLEAEVEILDVRCAAHVPGLQHDNDEAELPTALPAEPHEVDA